MKQGINPGRVVPDRQATDKILDRMIMLSLRQEVECVCIIRHAEPHAVCCFDVQPKISVVRIADEIAPVSGQFCRIQGIPRHRRGKFNHIAKIVKPNSL